MKTGIMDLVYGMNAKMRVLTARPATVSQALGLTEPILIGIATAITLRSLRAKEALTLTQTALRSNAQYAPKLKLGRRVYRNNLKNRATHSLALARIFT